MGKVAFVAEFATLCSLVFVAYFGFDSSRTAITVLVGRQWGAAYWSWGGSRSQVHHLGNSIVATWNMVEKVAVLTKGTTGNAAIKRNTEIGP